MEYFFPSCDLEPDILYLAGLSPVVPLTAMMMDFPMSSTTGPGWLLYCSPHWMYITHSRISFVHNGIRNAQSSTSSAAQTKGTRKNALRIAVFILILFSSASETGKVLDLRGISQKYTQSILPGNLRARDSAAAISPLTDPRGSDERQRSVIIN
ncbi:hypothetical protein F7725_003860 [Dissostichus mawsoni]|uniref:Uncharacterized protein n=1 Tax=Dissostichus mawsoni TaxID=36200 RepID=A0A7J5YBE1_DISMA|nr:hypothetical protein F7725_003860 [Dissostichus mawsoni]